MQSEHCIYDKIKKKLSPILLNLTLMYSPVCFKLTLIYDFFLFFIVIKLHETASTLDHRIWSSMFMTHKMSVGPHLSPSHPSCPLGARPQRRHGTPPDPSVSPPTPTPGNPLVSSNDHCLWTVHCKRVQDPGNFSSWPLDLCAC